MSNSIVLYVVVAGILFGLMWWVSMYVETISWGVWPFIIYPYAFLAPILKIVGVVFAVVVIMFGVFSSRKTNSMKAAKK
jgi:hypothetical protein